MDCILGMGLLREYVVEFDYTLPAIRLFNPDTFVPDPKALVVPFQIDRNNPVGDITIEMQDGFRFTASMVLDTGAGYYSAILAPSLAAKHDVVSHAAKTARRPDRPRGTGERYEFCQLVPPVSVWEALDWMSRSSACWNRIPQGFRGTACWVLRFLTDSPRRSTIATSSSIWFPTHASIKNRCSIQVGWGFGGKLAMEPIGWRLCSPELQRRPRSCRKVTCWRSSTGRKPAASIPLEYIND